MPGDCTSGGLTSPLTRPSPPPHPAARTPRLTPVSPPLPCTQPAPPSELSPRGPATPAAVGPGDPGGWRANTSCRRQPLLPGFLGDRSQGMNGPVEGHGASARRGAATLVPGAQG